MTDLLRVRETDGVPAPSDFELKTFAFASPLCYAFNGAVQAEGITWHRCQFHDWLGKVAFAVFPLAVWRWLYSAYQRAFDARDEGDTQQDALT